MGGVGRGGQDVEAPCPAEGHRARAHAEVEHVALDHGVGLAGGRDGAVAADVDDDHLAAVEDRRRAGLGDAVERQRRAVRHGAADDHPVVVGVDQPDLAGDEDAADVEVPAQRVGVEAAGGGGVDGVAGLDGQHQRKSSRRGVKVSRSTPGTPRARQPCTAFDGDDEGVAGADLEALGRRR